MNGIDVSAYQGEIDWAAVKASGQVDFAYAKASEGASFTDEQYARNAQKCREAGMLFGAYHYFRFDTQVSAQSSHFLNVAQVKRGDLVPMVDVEEGLGGIAMLAGFLGMLQEALKVMPIVYTYPAFWEGTMGGSDALAGHPLWIAEYNDDEAPTLPAGWKTWRLWQYSDKGQVAGIAGKVDLDRSNGELLVVP